jgi:uncharacterized protein YqeY
MLRDQLKTDLTASMKARDAVRTGTLRMLQTAVKNAEVEKRGELTDDEVIAVIGKEAKRRKESIIAFGDAGRAELVEKESAELAVLDAYLPEALSEDEIARLVDESIAEANATEPKHMGAVMKVLMPKLAGRADGAAVSGLVKSKLGA